MIKIFLKKNLRLTTYEKEHVSPFFYKNKNEYKIFNFQLKNDLSKYSLTVDFRKGLFLFNKKIKKEIFIIHTKKYFKSIK